KPSYPGPGAWLRGGARGLMRQVLAHQHNALLFHNDFAACDRYRNGLAAAGRVHCPATLVLAAQDQMTPPRGARELARVLQAQVETVPGGHFMMQEQPDAVLAALRGALDRRGTAKSTARAGAPTA
ncbi:MAG: alpha/beta hydrolase, partial [Rubrivivax sp.]|nr:alpha/beta hydrolase [Rubrivivax sp.]